VEGLGIAPPPSGKRTSVSVRRVGCVRAPTTTEAVDPIVGREREKKNKTFRLW
jgi:hypothetical protein